MRPPRLPLSSVALAVAIVAGCEKPPDPSEPEAPAPTPPPAPTCRPAPTGEAVAQWTAPDGCPISVTKAGVTLRLESLALTPTVAAIGNAPECRIASCRYEGVNTDLGPMLIATEPGAESEVPTAVYLGVVVGGSQLVFIDLWNGAGPSVLEDSTSVGPAHALVPLGCGDELGLFARPRIPGTMLQVPPTLAAHEGLMPLGRGGGSLRPGSEAGCRSLDVPLP